MRVVPCERVEAGIAGQLETGIQTFGGAVSRRTYDRIDAFLFRFLPEPVDFGRYLPAVGIYEAWRPRTPLVMLYRVDEATSATTILALLHHSQDRSTFEPE